MYPKRKQFIKKVQSFVVEKMMRNVFEIKSQSDNYALLKLFCDVA